MKCFVRMLQIVLIALWLAALASLSMSNGAAAYIGNTKTYVFHRQSCRSLPKVQNRTYFDVRKGAIEAGYRPCRKCRP